MLKFTNKISLAVAVAALAGMSLASTHALAEGGGKATATSAIQDKTARKPIDRTEVRLKSLHEQLHITADQEGKWNDFVQAERDGAKEMGELIQERETKVGGMNAVDDFKSYQKIAETHADNLKKVIPAFKSLYENLTDDQKKVADEMFKSGGTRRAAATAKGSAS